MSTYTTITVNIENDIASVTINRPKVLNALNRTLLEELNDFFSKNRSNPAFRAVLITGSGEKAFVAGADISEISQLNEKTAKDFVTYGQELFQKIEQYSKPVLAAINGFALGGGCELAMACHFRIASENAKFGQPEINLGIIPGYGGTQRLTKLIGKTKALELLITGNIISAIEAHNLGLINQVTKQDELLSTATSFLNLCTQKSSLAIAKIIEAVNAVDEPNQLGYQKEKDGFADVCISVDGKEGIEAFLNKRKAQFNRS